MPTVSRGTLSRLVSSVAVLEDFADRLSHVWTFWLLLVLACVLSWRQQSANQPILCATPTDFTDNLVTFAHAACWSPYNQLKYSLLDEISSLETRMYSSIWVYKWLPVVLVIQALLFKLPNMVLHVLHGYSGVSFEKIAGLTMGFDHLNLIERSFLGKHVGRYLYNWCKLSENCLPMRFLSIVWLFVKILFCANVVAQFALLDRMLSTRDPPKDNSTSYGDVIYSNLFNASAIMWKTSPIFPRRILCEFGVRQLGNLRRYTLQCELPINEFNEHVYMGVWVWLLIVAIVSCTSLVIWLVRTIVPFGRERYISRMLELSYELDAQQLSRGDVARLADLAGEDGVMVLKLVASNSSELLVRDAVTTMFQMKHPHLLALRPFVPGITSQPIAHAPMPTEAHGEDPSTAQVLKKS